MLSEDTGNDLVTEANWLPPSGPSLAGAPEASISEIKQDQSLKTTAPVLMPGKSAK